MWTAIVGAVGGLLGNIFQGGYHEQPKEIDYTPMINKMTRNSILMVAAFGVVAVILIVIAIGKK